MIALPYHPPLQHGWIDIPHQCFRCDRLPLESGEDIRDFALPYVIHGQLNAARDNLVLALPAIGSSHHRLDFLIGAGRALDPARHCIVCVDAIGNGLSSSPSNSVQQPGLDFPAFTIRDMVASQSRLVREAFGVDRLALIVGASMGGMQALQWAVSNPDAVGKLVAITPMAKTHPWAVAANAAGRAALMADPAWARPEHVSAGWRAWIALMQMLIGRSPQSVGADFADAAAMQTWLDNQSGAAFTYPGRALDWIWQSRAYDAHDLGSTPGFDGDTARALSAIDCPLLVVSTALDLYNPTESARAVARGVSGARYLEVESVRGHHMANGAHPAETEVLNQHIARFLGEVTGKARP